MMTLYYSPHATSIDNEEGRASGHADVPLSTIGRQKAQELGRHYALTAIKAVFCSDLQRARVTAELAFSGRGIAILPDTRLRECDFGSMTQCPPELLEEDQHITVPYPGGESWRMAAQRVGSFLQDLLPRYQSETIVVIGHKATKYAIEFWTSDSTPLESVMARQWEWREVPIWRYEVDPSTLGRVL
jgi:alpha-ribazole phosphatase/probable phosphoglycerate mutase